MKTIEKQSAYLRPQTKWLAANMVQPIAMSIETGGDHSEVDPEDGAAAKDVGPGLFDGDNATNSLPSSIWD